MMVLGAPPSLSRAERWDLGKVAPVLPRMSLHGGRSLYDL